MCFLVLIYSLSLKLYNWIIKVRNLSLSLQSSPKNQTQQTKKKGQKLYSICSNNIYNNSFEFQLHFASSVLRCLF